MANTSITIEGLEKLERILIGVDSQAKDWSKEFTTAGSKLIKFYKTSVFSSRGSAIGESWKKRTKSYGWNILDNTGAMKNATNYRASKDQLIIYNTADYYKFHQLGTRNMPQRIILKMTDQKAKDLIKIMQKGIEKELQQR